MGKTTKASKGTKLRIAILLPVILVLASLSFSLHALSSPVAINAFPEVPREGEPIILTMTLRNLQPVETHYSYELYADGMKVFGGAAKLTPLSSKQYQYSYRNPLKLGEQINFMVKVTTPTKVYEELLSMPVYPPQVWTSFVSFASFSTSIAGFSSSIGITSSMGITSTASYKDTFGLKNALNVGVIFSIVLIALLIHVELTEPFIGSRDIFDRLRIRFSGLSAILFIIFISMVFTQVVMIIGWVR